MLSDAQLGQEVFSDAKKEVPDESESDSSDSNDNVDTYDTNFYKWKTEYAGKNKTKRHVEEGNMKFFYHFTAQCLPQMITELKSTDEFKDLEMKHDGIELLELIREVMRGVEKHLKDTWVLSLTKVSCLKSMGAIHICMATAMLVRP